MTVETLERQPEATGMSRALRLRTATHATHEALDSSIVAQKPFESRERYGRFLEVQYRFHHEIDPLFLRADLIALLPDLESRRRLDLIALDMADLCLPVPDPAPSGAATLDLAAALGWLYVAEGSNLGAAFLAKEAAKLGLTETFGARHLAGAPEGRGLHWRTFTAALNQVELPEADEPRVITGAKEAFAHVQAQVRQIFG
ncbi:heme oxygenase [Agaricicola taiwanensis]|uniref:Heme oxygenase n=1 Tax=Agaricicola taiwanensis TaxID=591372 RepID=A0A8J2YLG1_9RHOB|nr:biliverdin-producing heme oxygenase [Agaricicola taiwanensis]GGE52021.1 heme oxygenase [Agaricicola taiwanensis]